MKKILLGVLAIFCSTLFAQTNLEFVWTKQIGGIGNEYVTSIVKDNSGNLYCSYSTSSEQLWFNNFPLPENQQAFISKIDSDGNLIWSFPLVSSENVDVIELGINSDQEIYAVGRFRGIAQIGDTMLVDTTHQWVRCYLMKLNSDGELLWARKSPATLILDMTIDENDNLICTGTNGDPYTIMENDTIYNYCEKDLFVLKFDEDGNPIWYAHAGTDYWNDMEGSSIVCDEENNLLIAGYYCGTIFILNSDTVFNSGNYHLFTLKLDQNGNFGWVEFMDGTTSARIYDMAFSSNGKLFITGYVEGEYMFDAMLLSSENEQMFISCQNTTGDFEWVNSSNGENGSAYGHTIAFDNNSNLILVGKYNNTINIGNTTLSTPTNFYNSYNAFITKINPQGEYVWVSNIYNKSYFGDYVKRRIIVDENNVIFTTGTFTDIGTYGSQTLFSLGEDDIYLSKLHETPITVKNPVNDDRIYIVAGNGEISISNLNVSNQYSIRVFNTSGQLLIKKAIRNASDYSFNLDQPDGIFLVQVFDGESCLTKKLFCSD